MALHFGPLVGAVHESKQNEVNTNKFTALRSSRPGEKQGASFPLEKKHGRTIHAWRKKKKSGNMACVMVILLAEWKPTPSVPCYLI